MNRYNILDFVGEGTFGTVWRGVHKETKAQVAIKCLKGKFHDWNATKQLLEFRAVLMLGQGSPHLVQVYEILREQDSKIYFVCEFMKDGDLTSFLENRKKSGKTIEPQLIRSMLQEVLSGLAHIHSKGFMHRDLKPENLLLSGRHCKISDFSLARSEELTSLDGEGMTVYVSTRWYRAPENVLAAKIYTKAIDLFALGCIMAEMYTLAPLFPGKTEFEQAPLILNLLGPLSEANWPEGVQLLERLKVMIPSPNAKTISVHERLSSRLNIQDSDALDLLSKLLHLNPSFRPSAETALSHPFFDPIREPGTIPLQTPTKSTLAGLVPAVSLSPLSRGMQYDTMEGPCRSAVRHCQEGTSDHLRGIRRESVPSACSSKFLGRIQREYRPSDAFGID